MLNSVKSPFTLSLSKGKRFVRASTCSARTVLGLCLLAFVFGFPTFSTVFAEESAFSRAAAAYQERDLDRALQWAKQAVQDNPQHVDAQVLLGELYYLKQDLERARVCWQKALQMAPGREDLKKGLEKLGREHLVERDLVRSDTHPFIVRFAEGQSPVELGELRLMLRDTHRQIGQSFGYFPDHTITILLYPEAAFNQVKGLSHQVAGLYDGKIRLPLMPGRLTSQQLQRVLWHEYTHALVHDLSKGRCPIWLNEGIAQLQEARVRPIPLEAFRSALKNGRPPSWDFLWDQTAYNPASMELDYQTAYMIAQYLVKRGGWNRMVGVLERLGQGYPIRDALKAQYGSDSAQLEKDWKTWLRRNSL